LHGIGILGNSLEVKRKLGELEDYKIEKLEDYKIGKIEILNLSRERGEKINNVATSVIGHPTLYIPTSPAFQVFQEVEDDCN
jgi:hypothetical protein